MIQAKNKILDMTEAAQGQNTCYDQRLKLALCAQEKLRLVVTSFEVYMNGEVELGGIAPALLHAVRSVREFILFQETGIDIRQLELAEQVSTLRPPPHQHCAHQLRAGGCRPRLPTA